MNIKKILSDSITYKIENVDYENYITEIQEENLGDFCLPCFSFAKILRKSPMVIAQEIKDSISMGTLIEKVEIVNGYINFFLNKMEIIKGVLNSTKENNFFSDKDYDGKTMCIDYSSVNLAKYMHIGHLSTTIIGESLSRIYEKKGYKVVRINYIGDYGTPFGKMVYAYQNWGNENDLNLRGVDYLQELYVEFCKRAEEEKELDEKASEYFRLIEQKDPILYPIYTKFIEISKLEAKNNLDKLGVQFDSWKGEASYTGDLDKVVNSLNEKNLLTDSQGAKVVDLSESDLGVCLIQKSNGSSLYATRDIAAAIDRYNTYKFDKMLYVTAVQQKLHFQQFFKVLELMGYDFSKNLNHVYYGMFSLPTGKIASRKGKQAVLTDIFEYAYNKAYSIVEDRTFNIETKESVANKIAMSALKFNALKNERVKDSVFDIDNCFNFDGDTSAYLQYSYARISSIIRKANVLNFENLDYNYLNSTNTYNLVLAINNYKSKLNNAYNLSEPSILSKYTIDLCKLLNKFYSTEKVISENKEETKAKVYMLLTAKKVLDELFNLICIEPVEEM